MQYDMRYIIASNMVQRDGSENMGHCFCPLLSGQFSFCKIIKRKETDLQREEEVQLNFSVKVLFVQITVHFHLV